MRYFAISDSTDTLVGLRLAGVDGVAVRTREDALEAIDRALGDPTVGILLIGQSLADRCADRLAPLKLGGHTPLVVEVPDPGASLPKDAITRYITEAIGVKL